MFSIETFLSGVNCSAPPAKNGAGTMVWDGSISFNSSATYTCGPYGNFQAIPNGPLSVEQTIVCSWNKSWTPAVLPPCVATSCPSVPFPPSSTGMIYKPDAKNNITLNTGNKKENVFES
jgi:hypothetical protein